MPDVTPTPDDGSRPGNYGGQAMSDLRELLDTPYPMRERSAE